MIIENILGAFDAVFHLKNIILMSVGVAAGLVTGAIPGFTITMAVVLTLPFTFGMSAVEGISTMIGVFVGGLSGGLMAGVLTGIPGTPSSVATTFDGYPMTRAGKPGLALGLGVWSSIFGGMISAVFLMLLAPSLAQIGLEFGPWDYFALVLFALTITASLAGENMVKGILAGGVGLLITAIGEDEISGVARFTFGFEPLEQGFDFLPVLVGLFAFSQLLSDLRDKERAKQPMLASATRIAIEHVQSIKLIFHHWKTLIRSSLIGIFVGILPGAGGTIANILAYDQTKKASKHPEKFGTGVPEGIIAPESSNNAVEGGALITMMALGIPGDIVTAVMLGALMIHNIAPSPTFISTEPVLAYSIMVSFALSLFIMLGLQAICLRIFVTVTKVPMYRLATVILAYCAIGIFALNNIVFDLWGLLLFGVLGYAMRRYKFPLAPMILGVVLGDNAEINLIRALATDDNLMIFIMRPWSLFFLMIAAFSVAFPWFQKYRGKRKWTLFFSPIFAMMLSIPMFMMEGQLRPIVGAGLICLGLYVLYKRYRSGWALVPVGDDEHQLIEG
ncbi:MAG: tripartite tricarboxylate transporter permease [Rhodospirillales bacterium]|nr:tripartite tricarboxylate transporter permease [Rhodospirillales bacterium]